MLLRELEQRDIETAYYDPADDIYNTKFKTTTRAPKLFLKDVNKLKKMRAVQELERLKHQDIISVMYGTPDQSGGGGFPGGFA